MDLAFLEALARSRTFYQEAWLPALALAAVTVAGGWAMLRIVRRVARAPAAVGGRADLA